ncbi:MAG TPA: NAD(+) diphosphatase [Thermoanaerobaculia bacterium]|nr:NAD(+) diphosphatase [Thermoanaerobaculia bacterium]
MRPPNLFASGSIDRAHTLRRDPRALEEAQRHPEARAVLVWRSRSLVVTRETPRPATPALREVAALLEHVETRESLVLLGLDRGTPYFALDLSHLEAPHEDPVLAALGEFLDLRQAAPLVDAGQGALLAYARAMMTWHRRHRFCGSCGSTTESRDGGHLRRCVNPDCAAEQFPRSDPAVIMLVHDGGERCLLGRQAAWPPGMFSTLAGFVEPGESLEDAVKREVHEEAGIRVLEAEYHSSQPWPFPSSIMLGFWARAEHATPRVDPDELEQARWLERGELVELLARQEIRLPPAGLSISRRLIDDWLEHEG